MSPALLYTIGIIVLFILLKKTIIIVPQKSAYIVQRFGKYRSTLEAGLHLIIPFIDKLAYKLSLKEMAIDVPPQQCITKDNIMVDVDGFQGAWWAQVDSNHRPHAYQACALTD